MKTRIAILLAIVLLQSCEGLYEKSGQGQGVIRTSFVKDVLDLSKTKSEPSIPDTNSFILNVCDAYGGVIYKGLYGAAPQSFEVQPGSYTVEVFSQEFSSPKFDAAQYGDSKSVSVGEGQSVNVLLECRQTNAGIRVSTDKSFSTRFAGGHLCASSGEGSLIYGFSEGRTGYFKPGNVRISLIFNGKEEVLMSRILSEQQVLQLKLSAGESGGKPASQSGISLQLDTSRSWISEIFVYGGKNLGDDVSTALSVSQAKGQIGRSEVWVYGYIVGGDLSSSKCSFQPPFTSRTNIAIAEKSSCTSKQDCISVKLSQGDVRDGLNLVDNPSLLGRQVFLKGEIVGSYYGIPGVQAITEFVLRTP